MQINGFNGHVLNSSLQLLLPRSSREQLFVIVVDSFPAMTTISRFAAATFVFTNVAATVSIQKTKMNILNSETLPGNLLPNFMFQQGSIEGGSVGVKIGGGRGTPKPFVPDDSCGDDIFDGAMTDMRSPQLPYLTQDQWTCDRKSEDIDVWIMEDEKLKVTITPQYSGKVWALFDKERQKDLLYNNRAHQPANIGALKSWAAGGAEWNWSPGIIGHSAFAGKLYLCDHACSWS